mmetsp:Transcript_8572/g.24385  ORF Transcript_8572/g.24385 Transcript_8572/m.24385 type:complete len:754 (+) Transcript_8572:84-2345(+)
MRRLLASLGLVATRAETPPLAPNTVRLDRVCFEADRGAVRLALYDGSDKSVNQLCASLTRCEVAQIHDACARGANATELARLYADVRVVERVGAPYPPRGARHERAGAFVIYGDSASHNIHSQLTSAFEQRLLLERSGGTGLDVVVEKVFAWGRGGKNNVGAIKAALQDPTRDWSRGVAAAAFDGVDVLALTKCGDVGAAWGSCDDSVPAAQSAMKSVPLCVDALFVAAPLTAIGGFPIRPSTGDALRELRERTKRHYGIASRAERAGDSNASTRVTLFTRNDAGARKLIYAPEVLTEMRVTRVVDTLVLPLAEQIRLFDEADVFVAPHGNNNVNSLWMRPGSLYVEVRPSCAEMCVLGCDKRFARAPVAGNVTFLDLFDAPLGVACGIAGTPFGAVLHQRTGVRFHVVSACVGGNRCMQRGAGPAKFYLPGGRVDDSHKSWKYNWNPQVIQVTAEVAAAVRAAIDASDDVDAHARAMPASASSVRATPFAVTCGPAVTPRARAVLPSPVSAPADAVGAAQPRPPTTPAPASAVARGEFDLYAPKSALKVNTQFAGEGLYALGDIVRINDGGQRSRATGHAGTIGEFYVRHVPAGAAPNASVLAAAVDAVCPTLVPANESALAEVVLHVRVGDVLCVRPKNPHLHVQRQPPPVAEVARIVHAVAGTAPLRIIFGFHFKVCEAESYAYLRALATATGAKLAAEAHPDVHFCHAVYAALFIQGKGGYSRLVRVVRDAKRKPSVFVAALADFGESS